MWYYFFKQSSISLVLIILLWQPLCVIAEDSNPISTLVDTTHPLQPLNLYSPRDTIKNLLRVGDMMLLVQREEQWHNPTYKTFKRLEVYYHQLLSMLDLSNVPPAARIKIAGEGFVFLYEILSRIELPPESEIPNETFYKDNKDKEVHWTIPHTQITLVRINEGIQKGQFLFNTDTVLHAENFYNKIKELPYRRNVPIENIAEIREYTTPDGWMISSATIENFPEWLKTSIGKQAIWKWIALTLLVGTVILIITLTHRKASKKSLHSHHPHLYHLITPILILILVPLILYLANNQLSVIGWISAFLILVAEFIIYSTLAWIAWAGSMAIAEAIIASPKISEHSLDAGLIRLVARVFAIIVVLAIILYVSTQLGIPLSGMFAGLGVGGIAIALAAQPTIENFIGSLNLFADRPVRIGDFCRYGEDSGPDHMRIGTVEAIGLRSTRIRGRDNTITTIPNADFSKMHIVNYNSRKHIFLISVLGLRYETTDDQLRYVIAMLRDMLLAHPKILDEEPRVRFSGFGDFSLNLEIRVNIDTLDRNEFRAIKEDIFLRMMNIVKEAGTGFAFPSSTVYYSRDDGLNAEHQKSAEAKVRAWCSAQELPFPNFSFDYRKKTRNTLDYPPEGSPDSND